MFALECLIGIYLMPLIYLVVETLNQLYELVFTIYSERPGDGSLDCDYFEVLIPMPPWVTRIVSYTTQSTQYN